MRRARAKFIVCLRATAHWAIYICIMVYLRRCKEWERERTHNFRERDEKQRAHWIVGIAFSVMSSSCVFPDESYSKSTENCHYSQNDDKIIKRRYIEVDANPKKIKKSRESERETTQKNLLYVEHRNLYIKCLFCARPNVRIAVCVYLM